jgi:hypothetical protein
MAWLNSLLGIGHSPESAEPSPAIPGNTAIESSVQFFVYDFIKIGILLCCPHLP